MNYIQLTDGEHRALQNIRNAYIEVGRLLSTRTSKATTVRANLITKVNPYAKALRSAVLRQLLAKVSQRSGRNGGFSIPPQSLMRAGERSSFGPDGVVPEQYAHLVSHVSAMCRALDTMLGYAR